MKLNGLIAATYSPLAKDGSVNLPAIAPMVTHLINSGVNGLYVCGSTGEGMSLTTDERKSIAESFIGAAAGRVPVIVQVGHNSLAEAKELAEHAAAAGADVVSATCPSYFKVNDSESLVACIAEIASATPETPFYYYHIPALTGSSINIAEVLDKASRQVPNLKGLKYTDTRLFEFQACQHVANGALHVVFGCDEMLLGAIATGATGAIGSTYNVIAPTYLRLIQAFDAGDIATARAEQLRSIQFIDALKKYPFHSAMKAVLSMQGFEMGTCRLPQRPLTKDESASLKNDLEEIGFRYSSEGDKSYGMPPAE